MQIELMVTPESIRANMAVVPADFDMPDADIWGHIRKVAWAKRQELTDELARAVVSDILESVINRINEGAHHD